MKQKLALTFCILFALVGLFSFFPWQIMGAADSMYYVASDGNCNGASPCYSNIQGAVNAAGAGDEIRVAAGTYSGVGNISAMNTTNFTATQVVGIDKPLVLKGGFSILDWEASDPQTNITTIDAQNAGRGIAVVGDVAVTIHGFHITGGNATGLGGRITRDMCYPSNYPDDVGGGIYVGFATAVIQYNVVFSNTGSVNNSGGGGGIALHCSSSQVVDNEINNNAGTTANAVGRGGGIFVAGTGMPSTDITALIQGNQIGQNTAGNGDYSEGGGLWIGEELQPTVIQNIIVENVSTLTNSGRGGGIYLLNNSLAPISLNANIIQRNIASPGANPGDGGGIYLQWCEEFSFTNNIITNNHASEGSGLYLYSMESVPLQGTLEHNTIAANTRSNDLYGAAVHVLGGSFISGDNDAGLVALSNNIISDQYVGILLVTQSGITAEIQADHTLFDSVSYHTQVGGSGNNVLTTTNDLEGDPKFVSAFDFRIRPDSAAVDRAAISMVLSDVDGEIRPFGMAPDVGADEVTSVLNINYATGAPDSYFTLNASNFPISSTATVSVNGQVLDTVNINATGEVTFTFTTGNADPGSYLAKVSVNPEAMVQFTIETDEPIRERQDFTSPSIDIPAGLVMEDLFLPLVIKD